MRVLLDGDGVLRNFLSPLLATIERVTQIRYTEETLEDYAIFPQVARDWHAPGDPPTTPQYVERLVWGAWDPETIFEPYPDAFKAVSELRGMGAEIYIVTAATPKYAGRTQEWYEEHFFFPADHVVFTSRKYLIRGDMLVDDNPRNVEEWARANPSNPGIVFARGYNARTPMLRAGWGGVLHVARMLQAART